MRKRLCILAALICLTTAVSANTVIFEDDLNGTDYTQSPFYSEFDIYSVKPDNFVYEGENGYYQGKWTDGASAVYKTEVENYAMTADIKTNGTANAAQNCYKAAIITRVPENEYILGKIFETDNGDGDSTSFLGAAGIYFYCFENMLEVAVHTTKDGGNAGPVNTAEGVGAKGAVADASARSLGVYGMSYYITMPEDMNFSRFTTVNIVDTGDRIAFYAEGTLICELILSDIAEITIPSYTGMSYTTVVLNDASGTELMKVEEAIVGQKGRIGFVNRALPFMIDNIKIETLKAPITEEPNTETGDSVSFILAAAFVSMVFASIRRKPSAACNMTV